MNWQFFEKKRVLVTGNTGFKGTWLTMILNYIGAEVVGFSNAPLSGESLYSIIHPHLYSTVWGDICDLEKLIETIITYRIQYVIHMAAQTIVRTGVQFPYDTFRTNAMGGATLLEAVRQCPSVEGLLFVSTDKVYKNVASTKPFDETHPLWSTSPYAASKCCAELMVQTYYETYWKNNTIGISVVRAGNVIGGGDFAPYRIIPDCVRAWQKGEPVIIRNPNAVRPYQHVLDALFAYLRILQNVCAKKTKPCIYNVSLRQSEACTTKELVELFYNSLGITPLIQLYSGDDTFSEDNVLLLNSEKLWTDLKYKPLWTLQQAVDKTSEWYRAWAQSGNMYHCCMEQIKAYIDG